MTKAIIFTHYKQRENAYTNGFISILRLSELEEPDLVRTHLFDKLGIPVSGPLRFSVLREIEGTADAEISCKDLCMWFETKIVSGTLDEDQIKRHLKTLRKKKEVYKSLILITPDHSQSRYIDRHLNIDRKLIRHLSWKCIYDIFEASTEDRKGVFAEITREFLDEIRTMIFEQDMAGIIAKIRFGDHSGVYENKYIEEMTAGKRKYWNTPREYKSLDGKGRKLLLYDKSKKGITVVAEIANVEKTDNEKAYPWTNTFADDTLRVLENPIPLERIRKLKGFENFGVPRKDRSPYRNLTHTQYQELTSS